MAENAVTFTVTLPVGVVLDMHRGWYRAMTPHTSSLDFERWRAAVAFRDDAREILVEGPAGPLIERLCVEVLDAVSSGRHCVMALGEDRPLAFQCSPGSKAIVVTRYDPEDEVIVARDVLLDAIGDVARSFALLLDRMGNVSLLAPAAAALRRHLPLSPARASSNEGSMGAIVDAGELTLIVGPDGSPLVRGTFEHRRVVGPSGAEADVVLVVPCAPIVTRTFRGIPAPIELALYHFEELFLDPPIAREIAPGVWDAALECASTHRGPPDFRLEFSFHPDGRELMFEIGDAFAEDEWLASLHPNRSVERVGNGWLIRSYLIPGCVGRFIPLRASVVATLQHIVRESAPHEWATDEEEIGVLQVVGRGPGIVGHRIESAFPKVPLTWARAKRTSDILRLDGDAAWLEVRASHTYEGVNFPAMESVWRFDGATGAWSQDAPTAPPRASAPPPGAPASPTVFLADGGLAWATAGGERADALAAGGISALLEARHPWQFASLTEEGATLTDAVSVPCRGGRFVIVRGVARLSIGPPYAIVLLFFHPWMPR